MTKRNRPPKSVRGNTGGNRRKQTGDHDAIKEIARALFRRQNDNGDDDEHGNNR